jgi:hypothetical protein
MPASEPDVTARPLLFLQGDSSSQRTRRPRTLSTLTAARGTDDDKRAPAPHLETMPISACEVALLGRDRDSCPIPGFNLGFCRVTAAPISAYLRRRSASTPSAFVHT